MIYLPFQKKIEILTVHITKGIFPLIQTLKALITNTNIKCLPL